MAQTDFTHPTSLKIGPVTYTVTSDINEWTALERQENRLGGYGKSAHRTAMIYLNPDTTESVLRLTLWHEVLHALFETTMGSPSWLMLAENDFDREEEVVRKLEAPTLTVLRDNPELASYLLASDVSEKKARQSS